METEHHFTYPIVHEITKAEIDDTGYPPNIIEFAKKLAEFPLAEVIDLEEYRHGRS